MADIEEPVAYTQQVQQQVVWFNKLHSAGNSLIHLSLKTLSMITDWADQVNFSGLVSAV